MADNNSNNLTPEQLRQINELLAQQNRDASALQRTWQAISAEIFGVSGAGFFEEIERSQEVMEQLAENARLLGEATENAKIDLVGLLETEAAMHSLVQASQDAYLNSINLGNSFQDIFDGGLLQDFQDQLDNITDVQLLAVLDNASTLEEKYEIIASLANDGARAIADMGENLRNATLESAGLMDAVSNQAEILSRVQREHVEAIVDANKKTEKGLNILKGWEEAAQNLRAGAIKAAFEWDKVANQIQRDTGIMLSEIGSLRTFELTTEVARFGMSLGEIGQFVGEIGEEMQTTNSAAVDLAQSWAAISMATGISTKETAEIGANLLKMGHSAESVKDYFEMANSEAKFLGVNSRKVLQSINKNLKRMQSFGFNQGEESLAKMAARAEQLRINIDDIFDVAERARTIEGAMQMAADLQLAAGSFSQINPMDLLAASREGPAELQKILSQMGSDIGRFENGKFKVDPIDGDRLRIAAEAVGLSYESMFEMIRRGALDVEKTKFFSGKLDFAQIAKDLGMDEDAFRSTFSDMFELDENNNIQITTDGQKLLDKQGIKDFGSLTNQNVTAMFKTKKEEQKNLELQAQSNMDLRKSMDALVASLTNSLTVFQPMIEDLTSFVNWINSNAAAKWILGTFVAIGPLIGSIIGKAVAFGLAGKFSKSAGAGFSSMAEGLRNAGSIAKSINMKDLAKFALALTVVGTAAVGFSIAMAKWGGEASMGQMATAAGSLAILGAGILLFSKVAGKVSMKDVLVGSLAMTVMGAALIPFAFAAQMMGDVDWLNVLAGVGVATLVVLGITALGALAIAAAPLMLAGAVALAGAGVVMAAAGAGLLVAAIAFERLAEIDWSGFSGMATALATAAPALLAFGLSSLVFANPLNVIGMLAMTGNLALLNTVMTPLADSLEKAADSMDRFVEAMDKMKNVVGGIDTEKLEEMRELADAMAKSAKTNAFANFANAISSAIGGGSSRQSGGGDRTITIKLIGENGREIKHKIVEDTAVQSGR